MITDLSSFNPNSVGNPNNTIFGLPFDEDAARLVLLPVPWEVTVSYGTGTARCADQISKASFQVDLFDPFYPDGWKQGLYMREVDKKVLIKSDYLRKEAELYINYITQGDAVEKNSFICKTIREINEGSQFLNHWVYEQSKGLLAKGKLVGLIGGDHSTPFGYLKALSEIHSDFGILQIDAHCDLRKCYEDFTYSHASIMYNALEQIPAINRLVQVGVRDYCEDEWQYICDSQNRVVTYFDKEIKERQFEGETWRRIADEIIEHLPQKVYLSFDIDGLDPKLCPNTGTPVSGGFEAEQILYLFKRLVESGRQIIGFDLVEVGADVSDWDANVAARLLFRMCNFTLFSNK